MPEVKCTVNSCEYWGESNRCMADQILITAISGSGKDKHGAGAERLAATPVFISEDTFCWTMTPKAMAEEEEEEEVYEMGAAREAGSP